MMSALMRATSPLYWIFYLGFAASAQQIVVMAFLDLLLGTGPWSSPAIFSGYLFGIGMGAKLSGLSPSRRALAIWLLVLVNLLLGLGFWPIGEAISSAAGRLGYGFLSPAAAAVFASIFGLLSTVPFPGLYESSRSHNKPHFWNLSGALLGGFTAQFLLLAFFGPVRSLFIASALWAPFSISRFFPSTTPQRPREASLFSWIPSWLMGTYTGAFMSLLFFSLQFRGKAHLLLGPLFLMFTLLGNYLGSRMLASKLPPSRLPALLLAGSAVALLSFRLLEFWPPVVSIPALVAQIFLCVLPASFAFGPLVPVLIGNSPQRARVAFHYGAVSVGNGLGFLLVVFCLSHLSPRAILLLIYAAFLATLFFSGARRLGQAAPVVAILAACCLLAPGELGLLESSLGKKILQVEKVYRGVGELTAIVSYQEGAGSPLFSGHDRNLRLLQTGHAPVTLNPTGLALESFVGAAGLAHARRRERCLILGVGSGRTAGEVAKEFAECDLVDLDSTVPALLKDLSTYNFGLGYRANVRHWLADAFWAPSLLRSGSRSESQRYDLIVNTVNPAFVAKANKIYTQEFLERLKLLLKEDGVFVTYANLLYSREAASAIYSTAKSQFRHGLTYRNVLPFHYVFVFSRRPLSEQWAAKPSPSPFDDSAEPHSLHRPSLSLLGAGLRFHPEVEASRPLSLVLASGHSGEELPAEAAWLAPGKVPFTDVDRYVSDLFRPLAEKLRAPFVHNPWHRYALDVNRNPEDGSGSGWEKGMIKGVHWARTSANEPLAKEVDDRAHRRLMELIYEPFHARVQEALRSSASPVLLLDLHSMPSVGTALDEDEGQPRGDISLGDFEHRTSSAELTGQVAACFRQSGMNAAINHPYRGSHVVFRHARPEAGAYGLQLELNRSLFMDEKTGKQKPGAWLPLRARLEKAMDCIATIRINL
jgi:N-formylglutamate deformylase